MRSPFKFLDSYTKEDREIFFGRGKEIDELYHRLFESRILLVYGESGTGKSSLVNCGLINKLSDSEQLPVYIRRSDNMLESLSSAIQVLLQEYLPHQFLTAIMFKKALREICQDTKKQLVFIFDQFEELFIFGSNEEKQSLVQVLKVVVESDIDCRFIFIIREEYFSNVAEFEKYIPHFLSNRMRIEKMDRSNAISAINGTCTVYDIQVEEGFAANLLKKLNPGSPGIELTYLQIFLDRVFNLAINGSDELNDIQKPISFNTGLIEKTGDVSDLLGSFLDAQIELLAKPEAALAILKSFVSYKGTKRLLNLAEVRDYAITLGENIREKEVLEILGSLVQLRILCDVNENGHYELRHDALAAKIFEKISASELEILEVRQFIESAYYFWKKRGVLLSEADLNYIDQFHGKLSLSEELTSFIGQSRVTINRYWKRRRNIIVAGGLTIILLLSIFSIWALSERNRAEILNIKALAEKYNLLASNIAIHDPTKGLRLAEYAFSLDSSNQNIQSNIKRIYSDNAFYTLIAKPQDATAKQEDAITSVAFSPDNKYILTGSGDATARLWDLKGNLIKAFIGHSGYVNSVAFSPDGGTILTSSTDRSARIWALNGKVIHDFKGHNMSVNAAVFSHDGKEILTGSGDGYVRIWDLEGNLIQVFKRNNASVRTVTFSPDGQYILTGSDDSTAILWNLKGQLLKVLDKHRDVVNTVAFSPDGQKILTGSSDKTAILWDLKGRLIKIFAGFPGEVNGIVFSPDGNKILAGASAGYAILFDLNGNEIKEFKGHSIKVKAVAFSPDGTMMATGSGDCTAKLWYLNENINHVISGHSGKITSIMFSRNGERFLTGSLDKSARIWDLKGNSIQTFNGHSLGINAATYSPDGQNILTGSDDGTARLWDLQGRVIKVYSGHKSGITSVAFSPDGKKVLTGSLDATARLWDIDGKLLKILKGHNSGVKSVAFSPDGKKILTGSNDYSARLWDLNGKTLFVLRGQSSTLNSVSFSPDGLSFLTGSYGSDPSARLWDLNGKLIRVFKGHTTSIFQAVFSPDGKKILTGSADQTAILWDIDGRIDQVFSGYRSYVTAVAFSPDGQTILIGMDNGSIRTFPVKKPYQTFHELNNYEKLTSFDKLQYDIIRFNTILGSDDKISLQQAAEYYMNEAIQSGTGEKGKYLSNAIEFYNKLLTEDPVNEEYLFDLLIASVYDCQFNSTDNRKKEIEKTNSKILNLTSIDDLTLACYRYALICAKNDSSIISLGITDSFFQICKKLMSSSLPLSVKTDISRWCTFLVSDFMQKMEFPEALRAIQTAQLSDSTNIELPAFFPIVYILNNQYDKAKMIVEEFKDKAPEGFNNYKTYKDIYSYQIGRLEDLAITHPDLARLKELLK
jgi:WD40 repeat protein